MSSTSDSDSDNDHDDLLRVYTQLMLDSLDSAVPISTPTTSHEAAEIIHAKGDGMNAKKRKLEKKKLKREENKRVKADLVEEAGECPSKTIWKVLSTYPRLDLPLDPSRVPTSFPTACQDHLITPSQGGNQNRFVSRSVFKCQDRTSR